MSYCKLLVMMGEADVLEQETATEDLSINSVFKQSYTQAKKHLHDGMSVIKEEFLEIVDKAGDCLHKMVLPVNNFLKDLTQIDAELRHELNNDVIQLTPAGGCGTIIPIEQALSGMMEENY